MNINTRSTNIQQHHHPQQQQQQRHAGLNNSNHLNHNSHHHNSHNAVHHHQVHPNSAPNRPQNVNMNGAASRPNRLTHPAGISNHHAQGMPQRQPPPQGASSSSSQQQQQPHRANNHGQAPQRAASGQVCVV